MKTTKAISIRVPAEMAVELGAIARTGGVPISEAIRAAIAEHIANCRTDPDFQKRLKRQLEEDREVLERLAGEGENPEGS